MTEPHVLRQILVFLVITLMPLTAVADVVGAVNKVRAQGCPGRRGTASRLRENPRLNGVDLRQAQSDAGYHAVASTSVRISGVPPSGDVESIVGRQFCSPSTDPAFREIGTFRRGTDVWIALAQPFAPPAARDAAAVSRRVLELTNEARSHVRRCGGTTFAAAGPLSLSAPLERAALDHSKDMAVNRYMDHTGRDGSSPADRITRTGYKWRMVGENLASGIMTPEETVAGWLQSPHHCENLMTPRFTEMGVAFAVNPATDAGVYWTQTFGTPR
jgi:uncharacterized protein YkwD